MGVAIELNPAHDLQPTKSGRSRMIRQKTDDQQLTHDDYCTAVRSDRLFRPDTVIYGSSLVVVENVIISESQKAGVGFCLVQIVLFLARSLTCQHDVVNYVSLL